MAGFNVVGTKFNGFGDNEALSLATFIPTFTWEVATLFEENAAKGTALVYAKDVSLPSITFEKEEYTGASLKYKFASGAVYDDIRLTFYDTDYLLPYLIRWRKSVWEETGLKTASNYKKESVIKVYDQTGQIQQTFKLIGSWLSVIKHGDLTYTSSDLKFVDLTITYDWAEEIDPNPL